LHHNSGIKLHGSAKCIGTAEADKADAQVCNRPPRTLNLGGIFGGRANRQLTASWFAYPDHTERKLKTRILCYSTQGSGCALLNNGKVVVCAPGTVALQVISPPHQSLMTSAFENTKINICIFRSFKTVFKSLQCLFESTKV
jgi:hypothetical protein